MSEKIWFTSDLHFNHDKDFIVQARGFKSVEEMNKAIIERFNSKVAPEDIVYILGDTIMGDTAAGEELVKQLNGHKVFLLGNHDTRPREEIYNKYGVEVYYAKVIKLKKKSFYLSHYPTITANYDEPHPVINLFGHTHQTTNFYNDNPHMYHVGVDSHDCYPVLLEDILESIKIKKEKQDEV